MVRYGHVMNILLHGETPSVYYIRAALYSNLSGVLSVILALIIVISYTLSREYRVVRNRYSRLFFTSEDRLCANLRVQEQLTNMTSQC